MSSLRYHLARHHPEELNKCEAQKSKQIKLNSDGNDSKQKKITDFTKSSVIKKHCLELVVSSATPFTIFDNPGLKAIIKLAAAFTKEEVVINPSNMKEMTLREAADLKIMIANELKNRFINLQIDMATCQSVSFFGKERSFDLFF